jgi:hypothetical protein
MKNKDKYKKEIAALRTILSDNSYWTVSKEYSHQSFKSFLADMHTAMVGNRRVTSKMEAAVHKAIKNYGKRKDPDFRNRLENIVFKLKSLHFMVKDCGYTKDYEADRSHIIENMIKQVNSRGTLSKRQFEFCNNMYKQFKKRINKKKKST